MFKNPKDKAEFQVLFNKVFRTKLRFFYNSVLFRRFSTNEGSYLKALVRFRVVNCPKENRWHRAKGNCYSKALAGCKRREKKASEASGRKLATWASLRVPSPTKLARVYQFERSVE